MSHSITPEQQIIENLDMQASTWANKIMTRKISNQQCKFEIAQQIDDINDMQTRVRRYLNAGLVTEATFKTAAQEQIDRIKQQAKAKPVTTQTTGGSKDGLWSKSIGSKK